MAVESVRAHGNAENLEALLSSRTAAEQARRGGGEEMSCHRFHCIHYCPHQFTRYGTRSSTPYRCCLLRAPANSRYGGRWLP